MTGWYASYRVANPSLPKEHPGHFSFRRVPVAYWDNGIGWVSVAEYQKQPGHLMQANQVRFNNWEFVGYYTEQKIVTALPGSGWAAEYAGDDGNPFTSPLVAWLVFDDGEVRPVGMGSDGYGDNPCESGNFIRLVGPDGENRSSLTATSKTTPGPDNGKEG